MTNPPASFGDNVRIRSTPITEELGVAGLAGAVAGETVPSVTGVEVIGHLTQDFALNVMFESPERQLWFAPDLVEFIDHAEGSTIEVVGHQLVRSATGEWTEVPAHGRPWSQRVISLLFGPFRRSH